MHNNPYLCRAKKSQGFTLVEVLIAGLILFLTLGAGLRAYEVAMSGSYRAAQHINILQAAEFAQAHIYKAINDEVQDAGQSARQINQLDGKTRLNDVAIEWQAVLFEQGAPPTGFDENSATDVEYEARFFKFRVSFQLTAQARSQTFSYTELAWSKQLQVVNP